MIVHCARENEAKGLSVLNTSPLSWYLTVGIIIKTTRQHSWQILCFTLRTFSQPVTLCHMCPSSFVTLGWRPHFILRAREINKACTTKTITTPLPYSTLATVIAVSRAFESKSYPYYYSWRSMTRFVIGKWDSKMVTQISGILHSRKVELISSSNVGGVSRLSKLLYQIHFAVEALSFGSLDIWTGMTQPK